MEKKILIEYSQLKIQQKEIEERLKELSPQIIEEMKVMKCDKLKAGDDVTFSIEKKKTWIFSPAVEKMKEEEKATGVATFKESEFLKFYKKDEDGEN